MFVFNKKIGKILNSFIGGKTIVIGSFKSNIVKIKKNKKKKEVLFVSTTKPLADPSSKTGNFTNVDMFKNDKKLIKWMSNYLENKNLKLNILGRNKDKGAVLEKKFFDEIIGEKKYKFIENYSGRNVYEIIDKFEYLINIDSTLCHENLARKGKSGFLFNRINKYPINTRSFGCIENLSPNGPFWTRSNDPKDFKRVLEFVLNASANDWKKARKKYVPDVIGSDPKNKKFLNIVKKIINKKN